MVRIARGGDDIYGRKWLGMLVAYQPCFLKILLDRFVTLFWPKKVKASKLEEIHAKMVMKESTPRVQTSDNNTSKKPKLSSKTNGSSSTSGSTSVKTNGKSFR